MPRGPRKRAPYRMVAEATWELARADYLGGMTARQVADKYVIGVHNLRARISERGWSKRALAAGRWPRRRGRRSRPSRNGTAPGMPWPERDARMWQTVFPQMANWLPDDEAEQMRQAFAREIERLKKAA